MPYARVLAVVVSLLLGPLAASAKLLTDDWFTTTIDGKRVGYLHERREQVTEEGQDVIRTEVDTRFAMRRMGTELVVRSTAIFIETPAGAPIRFSSRNRLAANDYEIEAVRRGDHFIVTQNAMGTRTETEIPYSPDILFPYGIEKQIAARALKPGARLEVRTFSPDLVRPTRMSIECIGWEEITLDGGKTVTLLRLDSSQDLIPGVTLTEWRDDSGAVHRSRLPLVGLEVISTRTTRETALLDPEAVEVLVTTLVDPGELIVHPRRVTRAMFELRFRNGTPVELLEDSRQRVTGRSAAGRVLEIRSEDWKSDETAVRPPDVYRVGNSVLQITDPEIQAIARRAGGTDDSKDRIAKSLSRWVHGAIEKKSLSVGLATASEVVRDRTGDCTEHAVLAAALARARGLPSKVAMGLVYLNGVFGYHMWTEVFVDGWHALDPALGQSAIDATHIKLAESALDQGFVDEGLVRMIGVISNLDIRVIEYERNGSVFTPGSATRLGTIRAGTYRNPVFGIRVSPPTGWRVLPRSQSSSDRTLVRLEGPAGARGELMATTISYDFRLAQWVRDNLPEFRVAQENTIVVADMPGRRFLTGEAGSRNALLAFFDHETLFTVRVRRLSPRAESTLDRLMASIDRLK